MRNAKIHHPCSKAAWTKIHLLTNPAVPGTPISDYPAITIAALVQGMVLPRPLSFSYDAPPTTNT